VAQKEAPNIAVNVGSVATAAKSTTEGATNTQAAAQELAPVTAEMQKQLSQFKYERRVGCRASEPGATAKLGRDAHLAGWPS